jgi:pimeloyl-ACP methyl ester carboxylesterase
VRRFVSFDGTAIAYHAWGEPGEQPPVVLQHGFSSHSHANWVLPGVVDGLTAAGRQVVAVDARGHGDSDKPHDPARYGEERMARDLSVLIDLLGVAQVDLVGYSMGGVVALIAASEEIRVRRLVTGGIGASAAEQGGLDGTVLAHQRLIEGLRAEDPSAITDQRVLAFRTFADAARADRQALAAQLTSAHRSPIRLDRITAPALVLAGTEDDLARRPAVLAAAIPGARWRMLAGDHLSVVRNPDFQAAIITFLNA